MGRSSGTGVCAFGKVRFYPEFVGAVGGSAGGSFSEWLDEGIGSALDGGGARWRDAFPRSRPVAFAFRPPRKAQSASLLLGVMGPSEDSIGRLFPFVVSTEMRESAYAAGASALPIAAERFLAEAVDVWALTRTVSSSSVLLAEAERLSPPRFGECAEAAQDLREWALFEGTISKAWASLFPEGGGEAASRALRLLIDAVVPMRSHGALGTRRSVRLPLGNGGGAAAAFWIEVIRALARWTRTFPAAFWPADRAEGDMLVCLGDVPASAFAQLWGAREADPLVLDVKGAAPPPLEELPRAVVEMDRLIADPSARFSELLPILGRMGGPLE